LNVNITKIDIDNYSKSFYDEKKNVLAMNAVTKNPIAQVVLNRKYLAELNNVYSNRLEENKILSQENSGRCWLFAGTNVLRNEVIKKYKIKDFELSQNYLMFWDKFEKVNYFLESVISIIEKPIQSRIFMYLLQKPIQDGGQWDMFVNLVKKYGVVPKSFMPETESSSNTRVMNSLITLKLREYAATLKKNYNSGKTTDELREMKGEMLNQIYKMLVIHLGEPPKKFLWQWENTDGAFYREGIITPKEFFKKFVNFDLDSMICLINAPTEDKPFNELYTVEFLGNVIEGSIIKYVNVDISVFKKATIQMIKDGKHVWFGCDVGKWLERDIGVMSTRIFDYELLYGEDFNSNKAERLDYGQSVMTHAMVFTGVDLDDDGNPVKWRVENSWSEKPGDKGYFLMTDKWFDEFMYEIAVEKKYVDTEIVKLLGKEPVILDPWDPMGALAKE